MNKISNYTVRDIFRKYRYNEIIDGRFIIQDFIYEEERNECPVPSWWEGEIHSRLPRGAISKFVYSINSALSNYKNGNISKFNMSYMKKKSDREYLHFEDSSFPAFIRNIESRYWFTDKNRKRKTISFLDIFNSSKQRGIEIIYEKESDRYFLHYPIEYSWFPEGDRRTDKQDTFKPNGNRIIALDPGVRKFLVGYDPEGYSIFIGDGANKELTELLYAIDECKGKKFFLWKKIKNMISELHWKAIDFLIKNYDIIMLPDFRIKGMVRGKKLTRITKRLLYMFSYFSFKEKLSFKCKMYNKRLIIVDESYTSRTCTNCGCLNNTKGKEQLECSFCHLNIDRDVAGSRNILIKNLTLR